MPSKLDVTMTLPGNQNSVQEAPTEMVERSSSPNATPELFFRRHQLLASSSASHMLDKSDQEVTSTMFENGKEKDKKCSDRPKKKSPWYSALYPTYKSRSENFKRIFKDVIPPEERLIVDYSCAIQRDILVHGRLYASQNYLCFYANIFRWETMVTVHWKEVTSITKEKTALVIPNAILIHTDSEKHFLTSFGTRDKTYLMLFRIWQNALMDKSLSMQEIWQWVHACYGDELGLTSDDDDDYIPPYNDSINDDDIKKIGIQISSKNGSSVEEKLVSASGEKILAGEPSCLNNKLGNGEIEMKVKSNYEAEPQHLKSALPDMLPTDISDNTDSDQDEQDVIVKCPGVHEGRLLANISLPVSADQLFTTLFTDSEFCKKFHVIRKNTDVNFSLWEMDPLSDQKVRKGTLVVPINQPVGPKTSQISETQILLKCSKPGILYAIDAESNNAGVPYADSFYITSHFCIIRNPKSSKESSFYVYCQIKYRKSVWGIVKSFIEKNCWSGLEEYYCDLVKALEVEYEKSKTPDTSRMSSKRKVMRKRRNQVIKTGNDSSQPTISADEKPNVSLSMTVPLPVAEKTHCSSETLSWAILVALSLLLVINGILFYKLWCLEEAEYSNKAIPSLEFYLQRDIPHTPEEWLKLLHNQERSHHNEITNWNKLIKSTITLLRQAEDSLEKLEKSVQHVVSDQIVTMIKSSFNADDNNSKKPKY